MPFNVAGVYSLPVAAFTPNTPILSASMNSNLSDIGSALTTVNTGTALSVQGRSVNSSGAIGDIAAVAAAGSVLRESGSTIGFGTVVAAGLASDSVTTAKILNSNVTTAKIADNNVTFAKFQQLDASTLVGNFSGITANMAKIPIGSTFAFDGGLSGALVTLAATGDVTWAQNSFATTIANDAVTNAKMANMAQSTIKGRASGAGTGDPTDLTVAQAFAVLTPRFKLGNLTRNMTAASGNVAYTGVGFTPSLIVFFGCIDSTVFAATWGMTTGPAGIDTNCALFDNGAVVADTYAISSSVAIVLQVNAANHQVGDLISFDADGFTLRWSKTGTPTGNGNVNYIAFR